MVLVLTSSVVLFPIKTVAIHMSKMWISVMGCGQLAHRLVGLVVRRSLRERNILGSNPACTGIFSDSSHTSDLEIGTPVATLPGAWRYRVSTGTGQPCVSTL